MDLEQDNAYLREQLDRLKHERIEERSRYNELVTNIRRHEALPDQLAIQGSQIAYDQIVLSAGRYIALSDDIDSSRPITARITSPQIQTLRIELMRLSSSLIDVTKVLGTLEKRPNSSSSTQSGLSANSQSSPAQSSRPSTSHSDISTDGHAAERLLNSLHLLKDNSQTFVEMMTTYLNSRAEMKHLGRQLVPQLRDMLGVYFCEDLECKQLIHRILGFLSQSVQVDGSDIGRLCEDLMGPVSDVVRALNGVVGEVEMRLGGVDLKKDETIMNDD